MNKKLTPKESLFCFYFISCGNAKEAAALVGFKENPEKKAAKMLEKESVSKEIERLYEEKKKSLSYKACTGYERLAFGAITDSVKLIFSENLDLKDLEKMDLFNVSEIKKPKDGAMEIKFFDRIKALEKLEQSNIGAGKTENNFYKAIENGIKDLANGNK